MPDEPAVQVRGLTKSYGTQRVLSGIDLQVAPGTVFALLGPNGAGKTTTVRILATLVRPDAGQARVAGFDVVSERHQVRRRISLTGQYAAIDELQTGEENLRMMGRLGRLSRPQARHRAAELLERFDLAAAGRRRVGTYSGGMRRRLDLAASLVGQPSMLFLDEPTTGLDPRSRLAMWEVVGELVRSGVTVFLTTQYLEEADRLADRVAVLDGGQVVAEGTPAELKARVTGQRLDLTLADGRAFAAVDRLLGGRAVRRDPDRLTLGVATDGSARQVRALLDELDPQCRAVSSFAVHTATLDDVFLALTGHPAGPADDASGSEPGDLTPDLARPTDDASGSEPGSLTRDPAGPANDSAGSEPGRLTRDLAGPDRNAPGDPTRDPGSSTGHPASDEAGAPLGSTATGSTDCREEEIAGV